MHPKYCLESGLKPIKAFRLATYHIILTGCRGIMVFHKDLFWDFCFFFRPS